MFQVEDASFGTIKYAGRSRAKVLDNRDPLKRGRIVVDHPILGETVWINYLTLPGQFSVPEIDDIVYVECDSGSEHHPFAWGNLTKGADGNLDVVPEEFQRVEPTNRGFYTPGGHLIEFDDGEGSAEDGKGVRITTSKGNKITVLEDSSADKGLITVESEGGAKAVIDGTEDKITAITASGDKLELSKDDGIKAFAPAGGGVTIHLKEGKLDIIAESDITVNSNSGKVEITGDSDVTVNSNSSKVEINASADVEVTAGGNAKVNATQIQLNGQTGMVLTNVTDPVVDLITGVPTMGVVTVKAG